MTLKILVAPSGFKESLDAAEVADCIEKGILLALPDAKIMKAPLVDGGEGFTKALVAATGGTLHQVTVTGPIGRPVDACYGFLGAIDGQTPRGKIPSEVAKRAKRYHLPVIALVGTVGENARTNLECGIDSYTSILSGSCTLAEAIKNTSEMLVDTAEQVMRTLIVGQKLQLLENQIKLSHKKLRKDGTGGKNCDDTKRQ